MPRQEAELQRRIRNLRRRLRRLQQQKALRSALEDSEAILAYIYADHRADVAAHFLMSRSKEPFTLPDAIGHVEWAYIRAPLEDKVAVMKDPSAKHSPRRVLVVLHYVLGFRLCEWVRIQNFDFGVAPSRKMMVDQFVHMVPAIASAALRAKVLRPLQTPRSQRKYFAQFRKRFGCKLGKLSAAPPMPLEEQQAKDWVETKFRTIEANKIFRQKGLAAKLQRLRKHLVGCQIGLTSYLEMYSGYTEGGRFLGPKTGAVFGFNLIFAQALAFFQWCNFALQKAEHEPEPLVINVDETSLAFHWSGLVGTILRESCAADRSKLKERRARATYICAITHDAEVQKLLPQVLLGNPRSFPAKFAESAAEICPKLVIWRAKSAWCIQRLMERYFRLLSEHLAPVLTSRNVRVVLDLAPCHLHDSLFTLAHGLGLRLIYVPPGMTSSLQPCDTHYFARFKSLVQERWRQEKSGAPGGRLTILMWAKVVASVIETMSLQQWRHAFESTGILREQQCLSSALLQKFSWVEKPKVSAIMPNENLSQWLFPKNWPGNPAKYIAWDPRAIRTVD